jgi:hypothetical protein
MTNDEGETALATGTFGLRHLGFFRHSAFGSEAEPQAQARRDFVIRH